MGKKAIVKYATYTDVGSREINEDSLGVFERDGDMCFTLCDGLGGHGMGDVASKLVVDVFQNQFEHATKTSEFMDSAFLASQDLLMAKQKELRADKKMKTTAVSVATDGKYAYIGYIGDSRVYVFNKNAVKTRTLDHSIPQMLALTGEIQESEIRTHHDRNILLRVLGVEWEEPMHVLLKPIPLKKCQAILCCSDGFWELIDEKTMCDLLKSSQTVEEWLERMRGIVKTNGVGKNMDNNTAIAVWCQ